MIMALVTTFMTSPLIHFLYVIPLSKQKKVVQEGLFSVLFSPQDETKKLNSHTTILAASIFSSIRYLVFFF